MADSTSGQGTSGTSSAPGGPGVTLYSPVLRGLPAKDLPKVACIECPHAIWQETGTDLRCYCRVMYLIAWSKAQPTEILACDGTSLGKDEE